MELKHPGKNNVRFNFVCGLLHGVFYRAGMAFSEPTSVLPVFLSHFTGSLTMIGVFSALIQGGGTLPLLFVANRLERACRKKPVLLAAIWVRAAAWGILGVLVFFWRDGDTTLVLMALLTLLFIFSFAGGVATVPFNDLWAKALPATMRGRFFGYRQLWGGVMALGAAYVVKRVLGDPELVFPNNYGLLFLLSFAFLVISYIALSSVREPEGDIIETPRRMSTFLGQSLRMIREDRNFGRFLLSRLTIGFTAFALPFYVLYGQQELQMPAERIGLLVGAQVAGAILSNIVWAELSDRVGNRSVIMLTGLVAVLIPVLSLVSTYVGGSTLLVAVFALIGAQISGAGIGFKNYLLEIAPVPLRPAYIAVAGTLSGFLFLLPIAGGFVVDLWGYQAAFAATAVVVAVGLASSWALKCVRKPAGDVQ
jgi:MFS family permease